MNKISLPYMGSHIRKKRIEAGFSTQSLSEELNVSTGFINNLENGRTDAFKLELLLELVTFLKIDALPLGTSKNIVILDIPPDSSCSELGLSADNTVFDSETQKTLNAFIILLHELLHEKSSDPELLRFFITKLTKELTFFKNIKKVNLKTLTH